MTYKMRCMSGGIGKTDPHLQAKVEQATGGMTRRSVNADPFRMTNQSAKGGSAVSRRGVSILRVGRAGLTGTLCAMMVAPPVFAADGVGNAGIPAIPKETHVSPLTQQEKVLQALNRFTFGPRPGDEAAVQKMGVEKWFEMQLHPDRIDDAAFDVQMGKFPAMRLSEMELMHRFPSGPMIRRMSKGDLPLPVDPVEHAIYADAEGAYAAKQKKDQADNAAADAAAAKAAASGSVVANSDDKAVAGKATGAAANGTLMSDGTVMGGKPVVGADVPMMAGAAAGVEQVGKGGKARLKDLVVPMVDASVVSVLELAPEQRMARLVAMSPEEMLSFRVGLRPKDRLALVAGLSPEQTETAAALLGGPERVVGEEALEVRLLRDVDSQRQLQAVMTDFWLNHFNVYLRKNENEPYMLPEYEQKVILPHALGKFEDLLVATAESPAMLTYLDNWESIGPNSPAAGRVAQVQQMRPNGKIAQKLPKGINENYGRELMELHTLGVGGGYTQKDVIEVAKCFTGWTVDRPYGGGMGAGRKRVDDGTPGEFEFEPNRHEPGPKVVLGHTINEGGMKEGLEVLHILATSPATAHFISKELAVRFVSDTPPPALVDRMAATFLKKDGDIAAVLTTMFRSKEFWAPQVYRAKVKTPLEFMTSALRASDATVTNALPLVQAMDRLGMPIYGMQTPNGYAWTADDWVSSNALISRMNFALVLSGGKVPGTTTNWPVLLNGAGLPGGVASAESEVELETVLLGGPAAARTREAVMAEFRNPTAQAQAVESFNMGPEKGKGGKVTMGNGGLMRAAAVAQTVKPSEAPLDTMAGLLLGSPEFQRR
jgi:uncharacterized protein (DUF1800 family)